MQRRSTFSRLYTYLSAYRRWFLLGCGAEIAVEVAMEVTVAYLVQGLSDAAVSLDWGLLLRVVAFGLGMTLLAAAIVPAAIRAQKRAAEQADSDLRQAVFEQVNRLPYAELQQTHSGELVSRLTNDVTTAKEAFGSVLTRVGITVCVGLACTAYMLLLSWKLAAVSLTFALLPYCFNRATAGRLRGRSSEVQASLGTLNARLKDLVTGARVIKAFRQEQRFAEEYTAASQSTLRRGLSRVWLLSFVNAGNGFFEGIGSTCMLAAAGYLLVTGQIGPGAAMAAIQLMNRVVRPFQTIGDAWAELQHALAAADRLFAILGREPEQLPLPPHYLGSSGTPGLCLRDLSFSYGRELVLSRVNLQVQPGQVIALVGASGSGKSTLFKLLLGLYPLDDGSVTLDGVDARSLGLQRLREMIAYVPQESFLYAGTVGENIAYGRPDASPMEIVQAAQHANAHDFIMALPQGYDTPVGERGTQLSGGQRQRISIARALLKNAPYLLLDEATASLDSESEGLVQAALDRLMHGRTTLTIAHRLSTVQGADCIHVLAAGQVVESGRHAELLARNGLYRQLYLAQQRDSA